jgi:hypothetical protein
LPLLLDITTLLTHTGVVDIRWNKWLFITGGALIFQLIFIFIAWVEDSVIDKT